MAQRSTIFPSGEKHLDNKNLPAFYIWVWHAFSGMTMEVSILGVVGHMVSVNQRGRHGVKAAIYDM